MLMRKITGIVFLLMSSLFVGHVSAHEAGSFIIRAGAITVDPHESSGSIRGDRGDHAGLNLHGKATLDSDTQLGLNLLYMVTNNVGVELLGATPFTHNVKVKNTAIGAANGKLGRVTHLPPTLSVVWYPLDVKSKIKPYVGFGLNYTWFFNTSLSNQAKYGGAEYSDFNVKNTWGWAAQVGADIMLTDHIMLNGQIRYIDIDTRANVFSNTLNTRVKVNLDVNPWVYMVGIGYKF